MCIKTISNFKRTKKRFLKKEKKKVCDVMCEFYSQGYRFSIRLRGIGLRHLFLIDKRTVQIFYIVDFIHEIS